MAYSFAANELFENGTDRPSIEFINVYKPDVFSAITRNTTIQEIILNRTMFPYYGRFLPKERRNKAFTAMINGERGYKNHLAIPKRKDGEKRFLRYCPLCVQKDRESFGETYWHRIHQITGIDICPIHKCHLVNSDVEITSKQSSSFYDAETHIPEKIERQQCADSMECHIAEYVSKVFSSNVEIDNDVTMDGFFGNSVVP
jgi:hypothetical protein